MPKGVKGFQKGQSGNPSGRPKVARELADAVINHKNFPKLLDNLFELAMSYDDLTRIKAIKELYDRAYGKSAQDLNIAGQEGKDEGIKIEIVKSSPNK